MPSHSTSFTSLPKIILWIILCSRLITLNAFPPGNVPVNQPQNLPFTHPQKHKPTSVGFLKFMFRRSTNMTILSFLLMFLFLSPKCLNKNIKLIKTSFFFPFPIQLKRLVQRWTLCARMVSVYQSDGTVMGNQTVRTGPMRVQISAVSRCFPLSTSPRFQIKIKLNLLTVLTLDLRGLIFVSLL